LLDWQRHNKRVHVLADRLNQPRLAQVRSADRAWRMAQHRNRYREYVTRHFGDFDYVLVTDTDLAGGWSYEGIADTLGYAEWDFVGSYGLLQRSHAGGAIDVHFDAWAYRMIGHPAPHANREINRLRFDRGDPLQRVLSCFGGLGIYRMEAMRSAAYGGPDCEHVILHERMRAKGLDRIYLNPSQIVLYSPA
ncbi:MAG: hypothetical protein JJ992_21615, partial [Planctomycetes bacterium]|nr:hypothetical protein [Planctomycetota bacterium]